MFERRHYDKLAEVFARLNDQYKSVDEQFMLAIIHQALCVMLSDDNPNFNMEKFDEASGYTNEVTG